MLIDARNKTIETIVEDVREILSGVADFPAKAVEECLANTAEEVGYIWDTLTEHDIKFEIVKKEGWGQVFKFKYNDRDIFTKTYFKLSDKLELYFWSEEYACKRCGYTLSRVNRKRVKEAIENILRSRESLIGGDIRDLAYKFDCTVESMFFIVEELGYKIIGNLLNIEY